MTPEELDQWRREQADKDADKCGLEPDTIGRHFFIFEGYRRRVREDVRPGVDHFADAGKPIIRDGGEG